MDDYKPNSHRYKEEKQSVEERKVEKIVKGKVKTRKKGEIRKLADSFISEDIGNIKTYVINEVLIPTIKNTIWDAFTNSLDMILFKGNNHSKKRSNYNVPYVSYRSYSDKKDDRYSVSEPRGKTTRFDLDDIIFETRGEAEAVRMQMNEIIDVYDAVSVADLYDMVDLTAPFTGNKYGWTNIRNAEVVRVREGYILKLPRPSVIK